MMKFEDKYFTKFNFTREEINRHLKNALKDLGIAKKDKILEVKFNYAYTALIKGGITLLSYHQAKAKSVPGHHIKIIDTTAQILKDDAIADIGNIMRIKRNSDLYAGGMEVTEKECQEYISFVGNVLNKIKKVVQK